MEKHIWCSVIKLERRNSCPFTNKVGYQLNQQADPNHSAAKTMLLEGKHNQSYDQPTPTVKRPTSADVAGRPLK